MIIQSAAVVNRMKGVFAKFVANKVKFFYKKTRLRKGRGKRAKQKRLPAADARMLASFLRDGSELFGELRLLVRGVVLVQDALACRGIDRRNGFGIERVRRLFVTGADSRKELLDTRLERGLDHLVLFRLLFGNQHALFRRFDVGHDIYSFDWLYLDNLCYFSIK